MFFIVFHLCEYCRYEFRELKARAIKLRTRNYTLAPSISMTNFTTVSGASSLTEIILAHDIERTRTAQIGARARALSTNMKLLSACKGERIELSELVHVSLCSTSLRLRDTRKSRVQSSRSSEGEQSR